MPIFTNELQQEVFSLVPKYLLTAKLVCKEWKRNADKLESTLLNAKIEKIKNNIVPLLGDHEQRRFIRIFNKVNQSETSMANTLRKELNIVLQNSLISTLADYSLEVSHSAESREKFAQTINNILEVGVKIDPEYKEAITDSMGLLDSEDTIKKILENRGLVETKIEPPSDNAFKHAFMPGGKSKSNCNLM